jgi:hypothetical protein
MRTPDAIRQRRVSKRRRLGLRMVQGEIREEVSIARRTVVIGRTIQTRAVVDAGFKVPPGVAKYL